MMAVATLNDFSTRIRRIKSIRLRFMRRREGARQRLTMFLAKLNDGFYDIPFQLPGEDHGSVCSHDAEALHEDSRLW